MIARAKRFLQPRGAVPADFQQAIGELTCIFIFLLFETFTDSFGDRLGHALSRESGKALGELVGIFVFDV